MTAITTHLHHLKGSGQAAGATCPSAPLPRPPTHTPSLVAEATVPPNGCWRNRSLGRTLPCARSLASNGCNGADSPYQGPGLRPPLTRSTQAPLPLHRPRGQPWGKTSPLHSHPFPPRSWTLRAQEEMVIQTDRGFRKGLGVEKKSASENAVCAPSPKVSGWDRRPVKAGPELLGEGCKDARKQILLPWDGLHVAWGQRAVPWARPWWDRMAGHSQSLFTWLCCTCSGV